MIRGQDLLGWTIYAHTADFPGHVVARPWLVTRRSLTREDWPFTIETFWPEGRVVHGFVGCLCASVAEARTCIDRATHVCVGRELADDPVIVESWV